MRKIIANIAVLAALACCSEAGAQFKTVNIGGQMWMAENLNINIPGSYIYNGNSEFGARYGRLYTWDAAQKACPTGWHLPSDDEWTQLINALGGEDVAGSKLKLGGASGFGALLGGYANGSSFWFKDAYGGYWSATAYDEAHAWYLFFTNRDDSFTKTYFTKKYGFSVRCLKN